MVANVSKVLRILAPFAVATITVGAASLAAAALPNGACCNPTTGCCGAGGFCSVTTQSGCIGEYKGDGSTCDVLCASGACCYNDGTCLVDIGNFCTINGGSYQGDSTACETTDCPIVDTSTTTSTVSASSTTLPLLAMCGDANDDQLITSIDALVALQAAVGASKCAPVRCDYNGSGQVSAPDAVLILKVAVGQVVEPMCPTAI